MIKRVALVRKRADLSSEAFGRYWVERHSRLAAELPNLRRYSVNLVNRVLAPGAPYDGFSELWWDSDADMAAAMESPVARELEKDETVFMSSLEVLILDEYVIIQENSAQAPGV